LTAALSDRSSREMIVLSDPDKEPTNCHSYNHATIGSLSWFPPRRSWIHRVCRRRRCRGCGIRTKRRPRRALRSTSAPV